MKLHANAALSLNKRRLLCCRVVEQEWTLTKAAEAAEVSVRCARKWVVRYRAEGELGLLDRPSTPGPSIVISICRRVPVASAVPDDGVPEEVPAAKGWTVTELLSAEKTALGFYITGHPLENYVDLLQSLKASKSIELPNLRSGGRISIGGIISDLQSRTTKKGDRFALLRLEDESGGTKCVLWPETYRKHSMFVQNEAAVLITGRLELSEENPPNIIADLVQSLDDLQKNRELIILQLPASGEADTLFDNVLHLMNTHPGNCDVALETQLDANIVVRVKVNSTLRVDHSARLDAALKELGCAVRVERAPQSASRVR